MNHVMPVATARRSLADILTSDDSRRDLEERMLDTIRMRSKTQRCAEAALLLAVGFTLAFSFALGI